jgi:hypothetical protein
MKCKECGNEMKYFKDYVEELEGYRCPVCKLTSLLVTHEMPENEVKMFKEHITYNSKGQMFLDNNFLAAYISPPDNSSSDIGWASEGDDAIDDLTSTEVLLKSGTKFY